MTLTPLSLDLSSVIPELNQHTPWAATPYGALLKITIFAWGIIPVDHPELASVWTVESFHPSFGLYVLVFMVKLPLLIFDLMTALLLYQTTLLMGSSEVNAKLSFFLWFLNPYVILVNEMWAAVDIYPTFLMLLTFVCLTTRRSLAGAATYTATIALKLFPIIMLPVLVVFQKRNRLRLLPILAGAMGVSMYFAWVVYAGYDPWRQLAQYDMFTQYFDEPVLATASRDMLGVMIVALVFAYALAAKFPHADERRLLDAVLIVFLVYFGFGNWFPQYIIWGIPFLTLDVITHPSFKTKVLMGLLLLMAFVVDALAFSGYFISNGVAFYFVPARGSFLEPVVAAYSTFAHADLIVSILEPAVRSLFLIVCAIYSFELAQRNDFLSRVFEQLSLWMRDRGF